MKLDQSLPSRLLSSSSIKMRRLDWMPCMALWVVRSKARVVTTLWLTSGSSGCPGDHRCLPIKWLQPYHLRNVLSLLRWRVRLIPLLSFPNASRTAEYLLAHFGKASLLGSLAPAAIVAVAIVLAILLPYLNFIVSPMLDMSPGDLLAVIVDSKSWACNACGLLEESLLTLAKAHTTRSIVFFFQRNFHFLQR